MTDQRALQIKFVLLAVTLLLCFAIAEVLVRFFWNEDSPTRYGYPNDLLIPDTTKGFAYRPGFSGSFQGPLYRNINISINLKGLRGPEHKYQRLEGVIRILGLGDSTTFGPGVQYEDTYPARLEEQLRAQGYQVEVINAGVSSYEFDQEYAYYMEEGYKYHPDIVILGVVLNDARRVNVTDVMRGMFPKERTDMVGTFRRFIRNHVKVLKLLHQTVKSIGKPTPEQAAELYFKRVYGLWNESEWNNYQSKLVNLSFSLRKHDQTMLVLLFPYTQQFNHSLGYGTMPQERIANFSKALHIDSIDLLSVLDIQNFTNYYLAGDNLHLNNEGNHVVAQAVADKLIQAKLLEKKNEGA